MTPAESVFEYDDLIDSQNGATVSRTLIDQEAATVTIFAVRAGQSISEHTRRRTR
ncbi:MAG: hypothetical protein ACOCY6_02050 [Halodesulfurarchaeum sp.]